MKETMVLTIRMSASAGATEHSLRKPYYDMKEQKSETGLKSSKVLKTAAVHCYRPV